MKSRVIHDRSLLLHGDKRNEVLNLAEIEQYGLDSFADPDYISIYGMPPREWYRRGIRLVGRTAVECTRDALGDRIGRDVASVAMRMPANRFVVIDPFAGSCNTLFWILRRLANSEAIAFESDRQVFELTYRNLAVLKQRIDLVHGDYRRLLEARRVQRDRGIVVFIAPPWGTALDEVQGLDLRRTTPPIIQIVGRFSRRFRTHKMLFAVQAYERVSEPSLNQIRMRLDWTDLRIYRINEKGRNHGVILGTKGWVPG
jgi:16S rRNA G966 N2-methylase RsmD